MTAFEKYFRKNPEKHTTIIRFKQTQAPSDSDCGMARRGNKTGREAK
ncbi:MAG: hypothetical protein VB023_05605 [Oscillibacter sp.]|nr:hypothetical protein [Oscillibacter sp.]